MRAPEEGGRPARIETPERPTPLETGDRPPREWDAPGRRGWVRRVFDRWADRTAASVIAKFTRKYALTPEQVAVLKDRVETAKLGKSMEHWVKRMGVHSGAVTVASAAGAGLAVAAGLIAPPALAGAAVVAACAVGGALFILQRRLRNALEGAAQMALLEVGVARENDTRLKRFAQKLADRVVALYAERYALTPEEVERVRGEVQKVKTGREKEFWQKQSQAELTAGATTTIIGGLSALALGGFVPIGLVPIGAGLAVTTVVVLWIQRSKLHTALDATAFATVAKLRGLSALDRAGPLATYAEKRAEKIFEKYAARYRLDAEDRRALKAKVEQVRDLKLDEFLRKRQAAYIGGPTARAGLSALSAFAAEPSSMTGLIAVAMTAALTAIQSSFLLWRRFDQAVQGVVFAAAEEAVRRRRL